MLDRVITIRDQTFTQTYLLKDHDSTKTTPRIAARISGFREAMRPSPRQPRDSRRREQPGAGVRGVGGEPPFMARAEGAYLHDIDGHQYIDYIGSWGPMILGHAHPAVRAAVVEALDLGSSFGAPTVREIEIAEAVWRGGSVDREGPVRFVGHRGRDVGRAAGARSHRPRRRSSR